MFNSIINYNPRTVQIIRSDFREQHNAHLLDSLMEEFALRMDLIELISTALETFFRGRWRWRMSKLYSVDAGIVGDMKGVVGDVQTHVVPEGVRKFLGSDFEWLRFPAWRAATDETGNEEYNVGLVEDIDVPCYCMLCDGRWFSDSDEDTVDEQCEDIWGVGDDYEIAGEDSDTEP
ncbi:hypothetical protein M426DRAFT_257228 [Hypoxylon sp. CI-4A]|nr:hypothetical protein M426DRAFT_257228 [Hypoxylon sp. CI-4A]